MPLLVRLRTSGFAITSLVLGIPAAVLTVIDLLFDGGAALEQNTQPTSLALVIIVALFCWAPALLALIFGLLARNDIRRDEGQTRGRGLAYAGITLGAVGLALPLLGILLFALSLIP
jgi:hypothetical protein